MYQCEQCCDVFDEPNIITTTHGCMYEAFGYEEIAQCPLCGYDDMTEVVICDDCERVIPKAEVDRYVSFDTYIRNENRYLTDTICNDCLHDFCERYFT